MFYFDSMKIRFELIKKKNMEPYAYVKSLNNSIAQLTKAEILLILFNGMKRQAMTETKWIMKL